MQVEARVVGQRDAAIEARPLELPSEDELRVRDLITHVVRAEVTAFDAREAQRRFVRVLTPDEITAGAARGRVDSGGRPRGAPVDVDRAVAAALEAFDDGLYLVFVDGQQLEDLDAPVLPGTDMRVRFVRLTALAGG